MSTQGNFNAEQEEEFFNKIDQVYDLTEASDFDAAEQLLLQIDGSISGPKENSSVGGVVLDSIYSFYEQTGALEKALPYFLEETDYLKEKMNHQKINSTRHFLTTGAIYYALKELDQARTYFGIAYEKEGARIFQDENSDYLRIALMDDAEFEAFKADFVPNKDEEQLELTEEQQELLDKYCEEGNEEMDKENFSAAIAAFNKALDVLPQPKDDWEATAWISASIGDAYFSEKKYKEALDHLHRAYQIYGSEEPNAFVLLRMGQSYLELNEEKHATDYLHHAYKLEGKDLFEDDKKYLKFLSSKVKL
ncbi:tetratricopeptide repeat protein [Pedobacter caeni]|uniref:Tetratricopeptide repeat-containing protein n=1 Tax=Pedobacter caeni TaxID=288992 RepID=A0A1M4UU46_9SPHI|nr:tetratricopeptide repeat protein [Pedobacter caeni]SHE60205.1 Tetratricopeptide repeat-containing protein [Pedobacter caeni]